MRLDKYISNITVYSRAETKKIIKKGVLVNNVLVKQPDYQIDEENEQVVLKFHDKELTMTRLLMENLFFIKNMYI